MTRNEILKALQGKFPERVFEADPENEHGILLSAGDIPEIAAFLKSGPSLDFDYLFFLTAVDRPPVIEVIYSLYSMKNRHHVFLKTSLNRDDPALDSVTSSWPAADWHEREVYDLFGVRFNGHPDLRRILLPDDWEGHPMRRDFTHPNLIRRPD